MIRNYKVAALLVAGLFAAGTVQAKPTAPGKSAAHSGLNIAQARAIALRAAPGRVISAEYEKEAGIWRYSFDIQQKGNVQEIGITKAGKIIENKSEGKVDHD